MLAVRPTGLLGRRRYADGLLHHHDPRLRRRRCDRLPRPQPAVRHRRRHEPRLHHLPGRGAPTPRGSCRCRRKAPTAASSPTSGASTCRSRCRGSVPRSSAACSRSPSRRSTAASARRLRRRRPAGHRGHVQPDRDQLCAVPQRRRRSLARSLAAPELVQSVLEPATSGATPAGALSSRSPSTSSSRGSPTRPTVARCARCARTTWLRTRSARTCARCAWPRSSSAARSPGSRAASWSASSTSGTRRRGATRRRSCSSPRSSSAGGATIAAPCSGAILVPVGFEEATRYIPAIPSNPGLVPALEWVAIGLLIVAFLWFRPQGVLPERRRIILGNASERRAGRRARRRAPPTPIPMLEVTPLTVHDRRDAVEGDVILAARARAEVLRRRAGGRRRDDELRARRLTGIIGPNGAGKSTALAMLAGTLPADRGRIAAARRGHHRSARLPPRTPRSRPDLPAGERVQAPDRDGEPDVRGPRPARRQLPRRAARPPLLGRAGARDASTAPRRCSSASA